MYVQAQVEPIDDSRWRARVLDDAFQELMAFFEYETTDTKDAGKRVSRLTSIRVTTDSGDVSLMGLRRHYPLSAWERAARTELAVTLKLLSADTALDAEVGDAEPEAPAGWGLLELGAGPWVDVVRVYHERVTAGSRKPVADLAVELGIPQGTARYLVWRARKAGLLGPARGREPGNADRPEDGS